MHTKDILMLMERNASLRGFDHHKYIFWKRCETITKLVILQHGKCYKQIIAGLLPNALILHDVPPHNGYWGAQVHDYKMPIGHRVVFEQKMSDHENLVPASRLDIPIRDLFRWVDETWSDDKRIQRDILDDADWCRTNPVTLMLREWARGQLRAPSEYFAGALLRLKPPTRNANGA